jgi:amidase
MNTTPSCALNAVLNQSASALSVAIHARQLSCVELMQATLQHVARLNPHFNAIVNLAEEATLLQQARAHDALLARGQSLGWMHGLPFAAKDTAQAIGWPTTFGSPLLKDAVATQDSTVIARMKAAGGICIAKTNMPELGLGSHTYNPLFGATRNAWDDRVSAGGSSGGAAVALALRLLPLADGSDFMGSLRNPAGWANIFGMRPSQGRVPSWPKPELFVSQLGTDGPMARTVQDLARLLGTQAGQDLRAPLSIAQAPGHSFEPLADAKVQGLRIGWLGDLGGHLATEPGIISGLEAALVRCQAAGADVEPLALGFSHDQLWQAWLLWRRALVAPSVAALMSKPADRDRIKPEALWEFDQAQGLSMTDFMQAAKVRSAFYAHMSTLFERYDVLALPTAQVWPFALEETWPRQIGKRSMDTYHRWMECTIHATFAGLPALSVPAGFDASGRWPLGLQLIGPPQGDAALLRVAAGYEALAGDWLARLPGVLEAADSSKGC